MGKTISLVAVLMTVLFAGFAVGTGPTTDADDLTVLDTKAISIKVNSEMDFNFFLKAEYSAEKEDLFFLTKVETTQIRIYDELDNMVYLLPVGSDRMNIGKSLLDPGDYVFIFDADGDREMYSSTVTVY